MVEFSFLLVSTGVACFLPASSCNSPVVAQNSTLEALVIGLPFYLAAEEDQRFWNASDCKDTRTHTHTQTHTHTHGSRQTVISKKATANKKESNPKSRNKGTGGAVLEPHPISKITLAQLDRP